MTIKGQAIHVNRANLGETSAAELTLESPAAGDAILRIDRFALTANNITYAVAPETMGYWQFFPTGRDGWGQVPVWGFADVVASAHPALEEGQRVYGYFPMATHLRVAVDHVTPYTMYDKTEHRQAMAMFYNQYSFTQADPLYSPELEGVISLFRPLFTTAFLLDDFHRRNDVFGAQQIILSSASSKTAMSLAAVLTASRLPGVDVIGLTSQGNLAFTEALGLYDRVAPYDKIKVLARKPTAYVDMAGNADALRDVHTHFDDQLMNSCRVGLTHWGNVAPGTEVPNQGPKPAFFFAPTYAQDRVKEWGADGFQQLLGNAWHSAIPMAQNWLDVAESFGPQAVQKVYLDALTNKVPPRTGNVLSMHGAKDTGA